MPSESQETRGYLLPNPVTGYDLICVRLKIPDHPDYKAAFYGSITELTKWWTWEKTGDTLGSQAAAYWRQIIHEHLIIQDCDELEFLEDCDGMAKFKMCWFSTENGYVLRYTLNDECTWNDVGLCGGSGTVYFPEPDDIVPQVPIDDDGDIPSPEFSPEARCIAAEIGFYDSLGTDAAGAPRLFEFIAQVILAASSAVNGNLLVWLSNTALQSGGGSYLEYYEIFKELALKWYPEKVAIENSLESATFVDAICHIHDCIPSSIEIDRAVLNCIADYFQGLGNANPEGSDARKYFGFIVDFIEIYPVKWIRYNVLRRVGEGGETTYCPCGAPPEPSVCDSYIAWKWNEIAIGDGAGWVTDIDSNPLAWATGDCTFEFANYFLPMLRFGAGWLFEQNDEDPKAAGSIIYTFDEPYKMCDFYAKITTESNSGNTRMACLWARGTTGVWVPLASKRLNLYKRGNIDLMWNGNMMVNKLKLVGTVGNEEFYFNDIHINSSQA